MAFSGSHEVSDEVKSEGVKSRRSLSWEEVQDLTKKIEKSRSWHKWRKKVYRLDGASSTLVAERVKEAVAVSQEWKDRVFTSDQFLNFIIFYVLNKFNELLASGFTPVKQEKLSLTIVPELRESLMMPVITNDLVQHSTSARFNNTILHELVIQKYWDTLNILIRLVEGALNLPFNEKDSCGQTPFALAIRGGPVVPVETIELLCTVDNYDQSIHSDYSPLAVAYMMGCEKHFDVILERFKKSHPGATQADISNFIAERLGVVWNLTPKELEDKCLEFFDYVAIDGRRDMDMREGDKIIKVNENGCLLYSLRLDIMAQMLKKPEFLSNHVYDHGIPTIGVRFSQQALDYLMGLFSKPPTQLELTVTVMGVKEFLDTCLRSKEDFEALHLQPQRRREFALYLMHIEYVVLCGDLKACLAENTSIVGIPAKCLLNDLHLVSAEEMGNIYNRCYNIIKQHWNLVFRSARHNLSLSPATEVLSWGGALIESIDHNRAILRENISKKYPQLQEPSVSLVAERADLAANATEALSALHLNQAAPFLQAAGAASGGADVAQSAGERSQTVAMR